MIKIENLKVFSDAGKYVRRKSMGEPFKRGTILSGETEADFEEVDTLPDPAVSEAKNNKIAEIHSYDTSTAVNSFTLDGLVVWLDKATRVGLMNSVTIEKAQGKEETNLWFEVNGDMYQFTIAVDAAIQMLSALEMYALQSYNATASHINAVSKLQSVEEIEAYDYKTGYPDKLQLKTK